MTLILSGITPVFSIQVSDRRITNLLTGKTTDSKTNKAVLFCNHLAFGYTGLAELEGKPTDLWLVNVLSNSRKTAPLLDVLNLVARRAEVAIRKAPVRKRFKHLAFAGAGWTYDCGNLVPTLFEVANYGYSSGKIISAPRDDFTVDMRTYPEPVVNWFDTGVQLTSAERHRLNRPFRQCARRALGPKPFVRLFIQTIREVAERRSTVGKDLMVTIIPRGAAGKSSIAVRSPGGLVLAPSASARSILREHWRNVMEFSYVPDGSLQGISYAPNLVCPGELSIYGFEEYTGEEARKRFPRVT